MMQISKIALFCQQRIFIKEIITQHNQNSLTLTEKYDSTITHFPNNTIFTRVLSYVLVIFVTCHALHRNPADYSPL